MHKNKFVLLTMITFVLLFSLAELVHVAIDAELASYSKVDRGEIIFPFTVLGFLVFIIAIFYLYPRIVRGNTMISKVVKAAALVGFILFLPQSIVLYDKTKYFIHNDLVRFAMYNFMEVALTRFMMRILYGMRESSSSLKK